MRFPKAQDNVEREALNSAFERIRAEWGFAKSYGPAKLLKSWQTFVKDVEGGYPLSIYDFTHDLSMRDLLEEIKEAVPPRLRQELETVLRPWDERFMEATLESSTPIEAEVDEDAKEWWYRLPKRAGWEMETYLLERGLRGPNSG